MCLGRISAAAVRPFVSGSSAHSKLVKEFSCQVPDGLYPALWLFSKHIMWIRLENQRVPPERRRSTNRGTYPLTFHTTANIFSEKLWNIFTYWRLPEACVYCLRYHRTRCCQSGLLISELPTLKFTDQKLLSIYAARGGLLIQKNWKKGRSRTAVFQNDEDGVRRWLFAPVAVFLAKNLENPEQIAEARTRGDSLSAAD